MHTLGCSGWGGEGVSNAMSEHCTVAVHATERLLSPIQDSIQDMAVLLLLKKEDTVGLSLCHSLYLSVSLSVCLCSHVLRTVQRHRPLVSNATSQPAVFTADPLPHTHPAQPLSRSDLLVPANPYLQTGWFYANSI